MSARTNEWQRVDNAGCFSSVLRALLLAWVVMIPYAAIRGDAGWLAWSCGCVAIGAWMMWRGRARRFEVPEMTVEVAPDTVGADETLAVRLVLGGEKSYTVRWWRAELMAMRGEPRTMVTAEFVVDPEAESAPVAELQMLLTVPGESAVREARASAWWVQVMVETERGRMESGRVGVRVN